MGEGGGGLKMGQLLMAHSSDMRFRVIGAPRNPHETNGCSNNLSLLFLLSLPSNLPLLSLLTYFIDLLTYLLPFSIYYLPYLLNIFALGKYSMIC